MPSYGNGSVLELNSIALKGDRGWVYCCAFHNRQVHKAKFRRNISFFPGRCFAKGNEKVYKSLHNQQNHWDIF
jgi:hypothetical protein